MEEMSIFNNLMNVSRAYLVFFVVNIYSISHSVYSLLLHFWADTMSDGKMGLKTMHFFNLLVQ